MQCLTFDIPGIIVRGTIIDLETTALEPTSGQIITFGYFSGNTVSIYQVETPGEFHQLSECIKSGLAAALHPFYAYNKQFEEKWLASIIPGGVSIQEDLMKPWQGVAHMRGVKWPKLRELVRPPMSYYPHWSAAVDTDLHLDHEGPHIWWGRHLNDMNNPAIRQELASLSQREPHAHSSSVLQLPNGNWVTYWLAAIICHNVTDLCAEASLLLWDPAFKWPH